MEPNRMTIEELIELKPSMENPIELVCDDYYYTLELVRVNVIGFYRDRVAIINNNDKLSVLNSKELYHYPSFKQPKKRSLEVFYEAIGSGGAIFFVSKEGNKYIWNEGVVTNKNWLDGLRIPNGRKLIYDHDNKELLAYDEELLK